MHSSVFNFVKDLNLKGKTLDVGSYNVNGCVREFFDDYVGVDMREGPNVDIITTANNLPFENETFDNVLCLEMLEHDARFWESIKEMYRVLKPNGSFVITTRSNGFPNHDYPYDYFRFSKDSLISLFEMVECKNISVLDDWEAPGVLGVATK